MNFDFITPNDGRWRTVLTQTPHDFYHLPEYVEFAAHFDGSQATAFYLEDKANKNYFLIPLLIRPMPAELLADTDWRDAITPYGYPSPIIQVASPSSLIEYLRAFITLCQDQKILSVFIRLHPLLPLNLTTLAQVGTIIHHGQTVWIDLTQSADALWSETRKGHRQDIVKLETSGFEVHHNHWTELDDFITVYQTTMEALDASPFYRFPTAYFKEMRTAMREHLHLFNVVSPTGQICAGGLFVQTDKFVQYHLSGTHPEYRKNAPSKLMLHVARQWAQSTGSRFFHLGGGLGANDGSLFNFKAGFSKLRADFYTLRIIINPAEYQRLTQKKLQLCGYSENASDYFPAYRMHC